MALTPLLEQALPPLKVGSFLRQNSLVVVALLISFSILLAAIVGFGRKSS